MSSSATIEISAWLLTSNATFTLCATFNANNVSVSLSLLFAAIADVNAIISA